MSPIAEWSDARILDRFQALERDMAEVSPLVAVVAALSADLRNVRESVDRNSRELAAVAAAIKARDEAIAARDDVRIKERREDRRALMAVASTILAALIAAIVALTVAGVI